MHNPSAPHNVMVILMSMGIISEIVNQNRKGGIKAFVLVLIGVVFVAAIGAAAFFYYQIQLKQQEIKSAQDAEAVNTLNSDLEMLTTKTSVSLPATDFVKQILPVVDPFEKTNPFNSAYGN